MAAHIEDMNEQERAAWLGLISVCQVLPAVLDSQLQRDADMTHFEFLVLTALRCADDRTRRMSSLAEATSSTLPRLSHVCTRLEKRGLIERFNCSEDRRATNARLTDAGAAALDAASPGHLATARSLVLGGLTPEQLDSLAAITTTIQQHLNGTAECTAARAEAEAQA